MGSTSRLVFVYAVSAIFLLQISSSLSSTDTPSPSPQESDAADSPLLSPPLPSPSTSLPPKTGSPPLASPPAPPPSDLTVPGPAADGDVPGSAASASASPTEASGMNHSNNVEAGEEGSKGMSGGKKAGIVVGVVAAACLVGVGGLVYKKRRANIRRSDYGYAARRELL